MNTVLSDEIITFITEYTVNKEDLTVNFNEVILVNFQSQKLKINLN